MKKLLCLFISLMALNLHSQCICPDPPIETNLGVTSVFMPYPDNLGNSVCINREVNIDGSSKKLLSLNNVIHGFDGVSVSDGNRKFCYNPLDNAEEDKYGVCSALVFANHFNEGKEFYLKTPIEQIILDPGVNVIDIINGNTVCFGTTEIINSNPAMAAPLSQELFHVIYGGVLLSFKGTGLYLFNKAVVRYIAQDWIIDDVTIPNTDPNQGNRYIGNDEIFKFDKLCNDNEYVIESFLMHVNNQTGNLDVFSDLVIYAHKTYGSFVSTYGSFADRLFQAAIDLNTDPTLEPLIGISDNFVCNLKTAILSYFDNIECIVVDLSYDEPEADLWMVRSMGDAGEEPLVSMNNTIYESPAIRNTNDKNELQNVTYGIDNYLRIKIQNRGQGSCHNARLRLYWSVNLLQQNWPENWVDYKVGGESYGDEITTEGGILIGNVPPNEEREFVVNWSDFIPDPMDVGEPSSICVYARIVDEPGGFANQGVIYNSQGVPEKRGVLATGANVTNFNNIAWHNLVLNKSKKLTSPTSGTQSIVELGNIFIKTETDTNLVPPITYNPVTIDFDVLPVPNDDGTSNPVHPGAPIQDTSIFIKADIFVKPDNDLLTIINRQEGVDGGTTYPNDWIQINDFNFKFENLVLVPSKLYAMNVAYIPKVAFGNLSFTLKQMTSNGKLMGGEVYNIIKGDTKDLSHQNILNRESKESDFSVDIDIVPNPSNGLFKVRSNRNVDLKQIAVYNSTGKSVVLIENTENLKTFEIDLINEPGGIYYLDLKFIDGENVVKKIIKN